MHQSELSQLDDIVQRLQDAQKKTWEAVDRIASRIEVGMSELEAIKMGQATLAEMGANKFWHKCHIRFGTQTAKSFDDPYEDVRLAEGELFYIDIGPIWEGIEGDAGKTFVRGPVSKEQSRCAEDSQLIFEECRAAWKERGLSGQELYRFAEERAAEKSWILAPSYVKGHRLSEFPHKFHTTSQLADLDFHPAPMRWVLEIQICDPKLRFGSFYEDILS